MLFLTFDKVLTLLVCIRLQGGDDIPMIEFEYLFRGQELSSVTTFCDSMEHRMLLLRDRKPELFLCAFLPRVNRKPHCHCSVHRVAITVCLEIAQHNREACTPPCSPWILLLISGHKCLPSSFPPRCVPSWVHNSEVKSRWLPVVSCLVLWA